MPSSKLGMNRRDFLMRASAVAAASGVLSRRARGEQPQFVVAATSYGKIRGIEIRGIKIFKGVPYGASTGGANRFKPALAPTSWSGLRDALECGSSAPQSGVAIASVPHPQPVVPKPAGLAAPSIYKALSVAGDTPTREGEDCLVLNLWTPALGDGGKRPVMLWLHGGGFRSGSGSSRMFDGTNLAVRGDVVVLTINHRLNVMGFANFSAFSSEFESSGQVGMLDIVHALEWVRANIEQFGGDPDRVMIFGQSGGGRKCETLLAMPSAKGLFHRAAIESGIAIQVVDHEAAIRNAEMLLARLGIAKTEVRKVQQLPLGQIMAAHFELHRELGNVDLDTQGFAPSIDGTILPQHPFYPTASPVSADVPVIVGCTRTEWTGMTTEAALWHLDEAGLQAETRKLLGDASGEMIRLYRRCNPGALPTDLYFLIASDFKYGAKTMMVAERRAALNRAPVYDYYFAWESPVQGGMLKTPHNMEIPFAFDNTQISANLTGGGPEALALADKVSDAWIAFARTGNPNTPKLPHWPRYEATNRSTMVFNNESKVASDPLHEQRIAIFRALHLS